MSTAFRVSGNGGTIGVVDPASWDGAIRITPTVHPNGYGWIDVSPDDARQLAAQLVVLAEINERRLESTE